MLWCLKEALSFLAQKLHLLFSQVDSLTKNITHGTFPEGKKTANLSATASYYFFSVLGGFLIAVNTLERRSDLSGIDCKKYLCNRNICKIYSVCFSCSWHSVNKQFFSPVWALILAKKKFREGLMFMTKRIVPEYIFLIHKQSLHMSWEKSCTAAPSHPWGRKFTGVLAIRKVRIKTALNSNTHKTREGGKFTLQTPSESVVYRVRLRILIAGSRACWLPWLKSVLNPLKATYSPNWEESSPEVPSLTSCPNSAHLREQNPSKFNECSPWGKELLLGKGSTYTVIKTPDSVL